MQMALDNRAVSLVDWDNQLGFPAGTLKISWDWCCEWTIGYFVENALGYFSKNPNPLPDCQQLIKAA